MNFSVVRKVNSRKSESVEDLKTWIQQKNQGYEVLLGAVIPCYEDDRGQYQTAKEQEENEQKDFTRAYDSVLAMYKTGSILILRSCGFDPVKKIYKNSYHFRIRGEGAYKCLADVPKIPGFDASIYKKANKRQLMRMPFCSKESNNSPLVPIVFSDGKIVELTADQVEVDEYMIQNILDEDLHIKPVKAEVSLKQLTMTVMELDKTRADDRGQWFKVLCGIKTTCVNNGISLAKGLALANRFSVQSDKYVDTADVKKKWNEILDYKLKYATLVMYHKEDQRVPVVAATDNNLSKTLLTSNHMDDDYAEYFVAVHGEKFIVFDEAVYQFKPNHHTWTKGEPGLLFDYLGTTVFNELKKDTKDCVDQLQALKKLQKIRGMRSKQGIVKSLLHKLKVKDDPFDQKPYLVGFKNGVYDLKTNSFRPGTPEDMVSKTTNYDWMPEDKAKTDILMEFINKIMPVEEERDYLLKALATGLYGKVLQNFFILTGEGSNGKDTLVSKLYKQCLGRDHYEYSNTTVLTEKMKPLSQEIANMSKKRAVVWSEPPKSSLLQGGPIKAITGNDEINARALYSKNTSTQLQQTAFMLCNDIPRIDNVDGGVARRIKVIPFRALFKSAEEIKKMSNLEYVHECDSYYDSDGFRTAFRLPLFHILTKHFAIFKKDGLTMRHEPASIQKLSGQYLQDSDEFYSWFLENYEESKDRMVQCKEIYIEYKNSDLYKALNKREQRLMTKKNMVIQVAKHQKLRGYYKEDYRPRTNGARKRMRNTLIGWTKLVEGREEAEDGAMKALGISLN